MSALKFAVMWPTHFSFPEPTVPAIVRDESGAENPQGIIAVAALKDDLQVIVPAWEFSQNPVYADVLELGWRPDGADFVTVASQEFWPPIDPGDKALKVPSDLLNEGVYALSYRVTRTNNSTESVIKLITVDRTPPGENQRLQPGLFPQELGGVISDDYLTQHGEVSVQVPDYRGMRGLDKAVYYWSEQDPLPDNLPSAGERIFTQAEIDSRQLFVVLTEAQIRAGGVGIRYFFYRLYDIAGNESALAFGSPIQVDLLPLPSNLPPARIPLSSRGLIDREHAREGATDQQGVTVEIDEYENADAAHFIEILWSGQTLREFAVDPGAFPLQAYVPWRDLVAAGLGPDTARVTYSVRYGNNHSPAAAETAAPFDFTLAGQDHDNAPALLNPTLVILEVRGAKSDLPDELTAADEGLDARILLSLFEDPQPGDQLQIYWGAVAEVAAHYQVQPGDAAGKPLWLAVPWRIIEQDKNNAALPVYYTTSNGVNQQRAASTPVRVDIVPIQGLPAPDIPQADASGYLNCGTKPPIWEGVTITVQGNENFAQGDTVIVDWLGYEDLGGTQPLPDTAFSATRYLTQTEAEHGFEVTVLPYDQHIEPMAKKASAVISYQLFKLAGGYGKSQRALFYIDRTLSSGELCKP